MLDQIVSFPNQLPLLQIDDEIKLFNLFEDDAYQILTSYFKEHGWIDEERRLKESRFIGVGTYRLLINVCLKYQKGSFKDLILFYEQCKRPIDDPHYEDLLITLFFELIKSIIGNYCYDYLKEGTLPPLEVVNKIYDKIWGIYGRAVNYLLRGKWARELFWKKQISKASHDELLKKLKIKYIETTENFSIDAETEIIFKEMANSYKVELDDLKKSLLIPLIELTHQKLKDKNFPEEVKIIFKYSKKGGH